MADSDNSPQRPLLERPRSQQCGTHYYSRSRAQVREMLSSKSKHYAIMGLVALDVASILADIFVALIVCDTGEKEVPWVTQTRESLHLVGLIFSSVFLLELLLTVWASGLSFFADWFHCFDTFVIVASFVIDLITHGIVEEIASLVIILRLWRFVKIVEELSVGASERMEDIEDKVEQLERENSELTARIQAWEEGRLRL